MVLTVNQSKRLVWLPSGLAFATLLSIVVYDSNFHFDANIINLKRNHYSAQRNWNINYGQHFVFDDSSMRYHTDLTRIGDLIEPGSTLISDIATSYYTAAELPVYVPNVHLHHGRRSDRFWDTFLRQRLLCYLGEKTVDDRLRSFLRKRVEKLYIIVNRDRVNSNLKRDCLASKSDLLLRELPRFSEPLWQGEYLNLYLFYLPDAKTQMD